MSNATGTDRSLDVAADVIFMLDGAVRSGMSPDAVSLWNDVFIAIRPYLPEDAQSPTEASAWAAGHGGGWTRG